MAVTGGAARAEDSAEVTGVEGNEEGGGAGTLVCSGMACSASPGPRMRSPPSEAGDCIAKAAIPGVGSALISALAGG